MERSDQILTVPCQMGWSDVGTWSAMSELLPENEGGVGVNGGLVAIDAVDCIVDVPGKVVALLGLEDLVIVDTEDAILVASRSRAQDVGELVRMLKEQGLARVT
jgi:mannose-1-phosphate guanylyltransferase